MVIEGPGIPGWISGSPLVAEHAKLMRGRYAEIPWDQSTAHELTPEQRARVAACWTRRLEAEYIAISTFSVLSLDLCAARAPADILSMVHRAAIDEIRHAEYCCRLAEIYGGKAITPVAKLSNLPDDKKKPKVQQALQNALLVSSVAETYATVVLGAVRDRTTDPPTRAVMDNIWADEIQHARIGWAYLSFCFANGGQPERTAAEAMIPMSLKGVAAMIDKPRPTTGPIDDALARHGMMSPEDERQLFVKSVREVLVPGFQALGLDVGTVLEDYGEEWAAGARDSAA